jgi:hypothetical protein
VTVANVGGDTPPLQYVGNCSHAPVARRLQRRTAPWLHVISAEGEVVTWPAWGSVPGIQVMPEAQALTARFISSLVLSLQDLIALSELMNL